MRAYRRALCGLLMGAVWAMGATKAQAQAQAQAPASPLQAATPAQALDAADLNAFLDGYVPRELQRSGIAGAAVAVVKDGQLLTARGYGFADAERGRPVSADETLFRVGSVSKLFTWVAVMQLVEQGKLDLDADVQRYLDFPLPAAPVGADGKAPPITLRRLASHTAGFEDSYREAWSASPLPTPLRDHLVRNLPARIYPAGQTVAYSNYGVTLAGYIVQRISGEPFEQYVQQRVLQPLGMAHSSFAQPLPPTLAAQMSAGFERATGKAQAFETINLAPAGSLSATATDMARFMQAVLGGGQPVLQPATLRQMLEAQQRLRAEAPFVGLGFYEEGGWPVRVVGHGGDTQWFHAGLYLLPAQGLGVFIVQNSLGERTLRADLFARLMARYVGHTPLAKPQTQAGAAERLAGWYIDSRRGDSHPFYGAALAGALKLQADEQGRLYSSHFEAQDGRPLHFVRVGEGVWQAEEEPRRHLYVQPAPNGAVAIGMHHGVSVWQPAGWTQRPYWMLGLGGASLAVAVLALLAWPVASLARRHLQGAQRMRRWPGRWGLRLAALVLLLPALGLAWLSLSSGGAFAAVMGAPGLAVLRWSQVWAWVQMACVPALAVLGLRTWRTAPWTRRLHLVALLLALIAQALAMWQLQLPLWNGRL